jgi:hypothetical protein
VDALLEPPPTASRNSTSMAHRNAASVLSRTGGRGDERVFAACNRAPAVDLDVGGAFERLFEPTANERMKRDLLHSVSCDQFLLAFGLGLDGRARRLLVGPGRLFQARLTTKSRSRRMMNGISIFCIPSSALSSTLFSV